MKLRCVHVCVHTGLELEDPGILKAQRLHFLSSGCCIWGSDIHVYWGDFLSVCVSDPIGST